MDNRTLNELAAELQVALSELALAATVEAGRIRSDGVGELLVELDGTARRVGVVARADLRPLHLAELPQLDGDAGLVFADRIAARTRDALRERGWGWLDRRRGHLRLWSPGLRLDASVTPTLPAVERTRVRNPFSPAGRELALWLLAHPEEHASPRALARELDISPGQVSNLLGALRAAALLRKDRRPLVPELFWALVEHWSPRRYALVAMPTRDELAASPELRSERWVLTDTRAAAAYGAPIVSGPDYPPDLYVPDERALSWLLARSVLAPDYAQRIATVAVAPTPLVCDQRLRREGGEWPIAHPVVVALDLANDRSRGRDVVEHWDPDPSLGVARVW